MGHTKGCIVAISSMNARQEGCIRHIKLSMLRYFPASYKYLGRQHHAPSDKYKMSESNIKVPPIQSLSVPVSYEAGIIRSDIVG
jgi:hypothetical protein